MRIIKYFIYSVLILCSSFAQSQTEYSVNWDIISNVEINGSTIAKASNAQGEGKGKATSVQVLFGKRATGNTTGYFKYVNNSSDNFDLKKVIGYSSINDPEVNSSEIQYGFRFNKNGNLKLFSPESFTTVSYTLNTEIKLERINEDLNYYVDGALMFTTRISGLVDLRIVASLIDNNAEFNNVVCSYETTPFCVIPTIDNPNKSISLQITGANPPYEYVWEGVGDGMCRTACDFETFIEGQNTVLIVDALGNKTRRTYSLGTDVIWGNFYQSESNGFILSNNAVNNSWGAAKLNTNFASNSTSWCEYVIEKENSGKKAFGFTDGAKTVRKTRHIKAGFLISQQQIQVIDNGAIVLSMDYLDKDVLNIQYFNGFVSWLLNGVAVYESSYVINGDITIAGLVKNNGTLNHINYSTNYPSIVNSVWDETTETGSVNVDISSLNTTGPYHYFISEQPVAHINDIYTFLKDSIGIITDSVAFYTGNETATTYDFNGLESGTYFVSAFNSTGQRLFSKEIHVQGDFVFENQTGLSTIGNEIFASNQADGTGSLELYVSNELDSKFDLTINRINREAFWGFSETTTNPQSYQDLKYGFYLINKKLFTVQDGVLSTESYRMRRQDELAIETKEDEINLLLSDQVISTAILPTNYTYKIAIGLSQGQKAVLKGKGGKKEQLQIFSDVSYGTCFGSFGEILVSVSINNPNVVVNSVELSLDSSNDLIQSNPNNQFLFENLIPGVYIIEIEYTTANGSALTATEQVRVESSINWSNQIETVYNSSNESLKRNFGSSFTTLGTAKANHSLLSSEPNKVYFRVELPGVLGWTAINWSSDIYNTSNLGQITDGIYLTNIYGLHLIYNAASPGPPISFMPSNRFIYSYENGQANLRKSQNISTGPIVTSHSVSSTSPQFHVFPGIIPSGIYDVSTNMSCNIPNQYAEVKRKITGVKYKVYLNKVLFYMDEEYFDDNDFLSYKVFGTTDRINPVLDGDDLSDQVLNDNKHGDNRYELDVSSLTAGVYLLEVENQKKEKFYLRFIK